MMSSSDSAGVTVVDDGTDVAGGVGVDVSEVFDAHAEVTINPNEIKIRPILMGISPWKFLSGTNCWKTRTSGGWAVRPI